MELVDRSQPAKNLLTGRHKITIPAGKSLKIETSPDGEDILNAEVPTGKTWDVILIIEIVET